MQKVWLIGLVALAGLLTACAGDGVGPAGPASECPIGTALFTPGCDIPAPTWGKGCYASCSAVGDDSECPPGYACQETSVDPCVPQPGETGGCDACGQQLHLCMALPAAKSRETNTDCMKLGVDACADDPSCGVITALAITTAEHCRSALPVPVGCIPATTGCSASISYARDPNGGDWQFSSGCHPDGWSDFRPDFEGTVGLWPVCSKPSCERKSLEACKLDARCGVSSGWKIDLERKCIGEAAEVGCEDSVSRPCGAAYTIAADAAGQPYWFGDTCIPPSLTYLEPVDGSPQVTWATYPRCAGL